MKKTLFIFTLLSILILSCNQKKGATNPTFQINNEKIVFENNSYKSESGTFQLLQSERGDVNSDGNEDMISLIQMQSGGSGTFYYLNLLISDTDGNLKFSDENFIGDRIIPEYLSIYKEGSVSKLTGVAIHPDDYGHIVFGYYTHEKEQAFSEEPKLFLTPTWTVEKGKLKSIEQY